MSVVTVRRHVPAELDDVWQRLVDVERLVIDDPSLDLMDLEGDGRLTTGARAVISRRQGARLATFDVRVLDAVAPRRLWLAVAAGRESWLVDATLTDDAHGILISVEARLDPDATPPAVLQGLTRPLDLGLYQQVAELVGIWIGHTVAALEAVLAGPHLPMPRSVGAAR
ncbi:hypothetical protein [Egicoccus sp. AB-alg2]|uniref:hypothetical protein n=1 Tax=Egicoccus sp. AB-alg2 TaxID=3242693 RepID=UPI00359DB85D